MLRAIHQHHRTPLWQQLRLYPLFYLLTLIIIKAEKEPPNGPVLGGSKVPSCLGSLTPNYICVALSR
jgi:hypothetical protein